MGVENVFFFDIPYESVRYGVGDVEILIQGTELRYLGGSGVKQEKKKNFMQKYKEGDFVKN